MNNKEFKGNFDKGSKEYISKSFKLAFTNALFFFFAIALIVLLFNLYELSHISKTQLIFISIPIVLVWLGLSLRIKLRELFISKKFGKR